MKKFMAVLGFTLLCASAALAQFDIKAIKVIGKPSNKKWKVTMQCQKDRGYRAVFSEGKGGPNLPLQEWALTPGDILFQTAVWSPDGKYLLLFDQPESGKVSMTKNGIWRARPYLYDPAKKTVFGPVNWMVDDLDITGAGWDKKSNNVILREFYEASTDRFKVEKITIKEWEKTSSGVDQSPYPRGFMDSIEMEMTLMDVPAIEKLLADAPNDPTKKGLIRFFKKAVKEKAKLFYGGGLEYLFRKKDNSVAIIFTYVFSKQTSCLGNYVFEFTPSSMAASGFAIKIAGFTECPKLD